MYTQDLTVDHSCQRKVVEYLTTISPDIGRAVLSVTFVIETIDLSDLTRLVISPYESDSIWISDFESEQEEKRLDTVETTVDEVA